MLSVVKLHDVTHLNYHLISKYLSFSICTSYLHSIHNNDWSTKASYQKTNFHNVYLFCCQVDCVIYHFSIFLICGLKLCYGAERERVTFLLRFLEYTDTQVIYAIYKGKLVAGKNIH